MADIFLSYEVSINLFVQFTLFLLLSSAFYSTLYILKYYKKNATTQAQYALEKKSYLVISIIQLSLVFKIILLPFFTYTLDELSNIIPGAMCAAGVISANFYGEPLMLLKIFIILLILLWILLNKEDLHSKNFQYFQTKLWFFVGIYLLIIIETIVEFLYFNNLSTLSPVLCCSNLYKSSAQTASFVFSNFTLILSFFSVYLLILLSAYTQKRVLLFLLSLVFLYLSYLSIVNFFSTYIYQLPSHKCPYCMLQGEYYYIGYFIYSSLILGTFYAWSSCFYKFYKQGFKYSMLFYSIFIFLIFFNYLKYIISNGMFL